MLPILHPMEKTKTEVKRSVQRLELYIKNNPNEEKTKTVLEKLKEILEII
jgi:cell division protein FtsX